MAPKLLGTLWYWETYAGMSATFHIDAATADRKRAHDYVKRVYGVRTLSLLLGCAMVATVLERTGASAWIWALLVVYVFAWPHAAYAIAKRRIDVIKAEKRNIMADAAMVGVWMALMRFSLLPCVTLAMPLGMLLLSNGGGRMMARGFALMVLGGAGVALAARTGLEPHSSLSETIAALPVLVIVPWLTSAMMYRLEHRVRAQNRLLAKLGSIDSLSELLNRRHWDEAVAQALDAHRRAGKPAALLLIDVDHFKQINDRYGHTLGDEVITAIGGIIRASLRAGDVAGRYGGDEFAVLLLDADEHAAELVAGRILAGVAGARFAGAPGLQCTASIGITSSGTSASASARDWVKQADSALYRAKANGRNCFAIAAA
jgi:diguanylate cyclase